VAELSGSSSFTRNCSMRIRQASPSSWISFIRVPEE
jgi:hypothetical protein